MLCYLICSLLLTVQPAPPLGGGSGLDLFKAANGKDAVGWGKAETIKMVREQRIPFEVPIDPFYSEANVSMLRRSVAQVKEN